jgi:hypothetical protein
MNDHASLKTENDSYQLIPEIAKVDNAIIQRNYQRIKQEVQDIIETEMERVLNDPEKET